MQDGDDVQLHLHRGKDRERDGDGGDNDGKRPHALLHPDEKTGRADDHDGGGADVDHLSVPRQRRAPQDPHRDDDDHVQEDLRQLGHPVEVLAALPCHPVL